MEENIESFFRLEYPRFELLFSVAESGDPAREIVERMMKKYPRVAAQLFIGDIDIGPNPKVNNMIRGYEKARFDWILISDSNTRVDPIYLRRLTPHLNARVGVLSAVVAGRNPDGVGGLLEAAYLNTFFARWTHLAAVLGRPFVIGKSMCFRKSTAERFGGIRNLAHYIAEDHMLGQAVLRLGLKVVIMTDPVKQHIGDYKISSFWKRHVRWGRIRKSQAPLVFLFEPFVGALMSGLMGAIAFKNWLGVPPELFFLAHVGLWSLCDGLMIYRLESKLKMKAIFAWVLRELLALPLWIHMACGSTILWRGNRLKIMPGGLVTNGATLPSEETFLNRRNNPTDVFPLGCGHQQSSD